MSSPLGIPGLLQPEVIGRGGFGTVYRVQEPEFGREVAVKVISDQLDGEDLRLAFERECRAMGALSGHPHIIAVHRGGTTERGEPYIVMDLMTSGSLADRLLGDGALSWPEVLEIGVSIAGALETAHRASILHLDVKPANVLMSRYGEPKLADFGISRLPGITTTTDGRVRASVPFAAPERLLDGTTVPASDLYALGATLFTLLAGEPAFSTRSGEDLAVAIARIVREPLPDLRQHGVPDAVVQVVERLMAKSPLDRFATAADAAFALQSAQRATGRPVTKAVVEGAPPLRGETRTWSMLPPGRWALGALDPGADQAPHPRPAYVPRPRSTGSTAGALRPNPLLGPDAVGIPSAEVAAQTPGATPARGPSRSRLPWIAALAAGLVLVLGVGVAMTWNRSGTAPGPHVPVVPAASTPTTVPPKPAPSGTTGVDLQIQLASDVRHPDRTAVAAHLDSYFQAINEHDYATAFARFSPESAVAGHGFAAFRDGYSTTVVQRMRIIAISDLAGGGVQATVTYRSTQAAELGPNGETCTNWRLAYEMVGTERLIRRARVLSEPQAC